MDNSSLQRIRYNQMLTPGPIIINTPQQYVDIDSVIPSYQLGLKMKYGFMKPERRNLKYELVYN
uniref:Uncharacterized protein n=1 Tax=viral metagenome TaxID=1070528 RepID=A0A6C0JSE2_9ZZZZ